jgi:hypothetical protein
MNVYVKSMSESQVSAMDALSEKLDLCNVRRKEAKLKFVSNSFQKEDGAEGES